MRRVLVVLLAMVAFVPFLPGSPAHAAPALIGMVMDTVTGKAIEFDAVTSTVTGSLSLPNVGNTGDCSITPDGKTAAAVVFNSKVYFMNLTTGVPTLFIGNNPVTIANLGEDTSMTPDGKFVVVSDGSAVSPLSVISTVNRFQLSTPNLTANDHNSVEVLPTGAVLATSSNASKVSRGFINGFGQMSSAGGTLAAGGEPNNVVGAPTGIAGAVVTRAAHTVKSFKIAGLIGVDTRTLTGVFGLSAVINPAGNRLFVRSNTPGSIDVYAFNSTTGTIGAAPLFTIAIANTPDTFFGIDNMAITPDGLRLFVSQPSAVNVYNTTTGALLGSMTNPNIVSPSGICLAKTSAIPVTCPTITFLPFSLPVGTLGQMYFHSPFYLQGGKPTFTFKLFGKLPLGLVFGGNTLHGAPDEVGTYPIDVFGTDSVGCTASRHYDLIIQKGQTQGPIMMRRITQTSRPRAVVARRGAYRGGLTVTSG